MTITKLKEINLLSNGDKYMANICGNRVHLEGSPEVIENFIRVAQQTAKDVLDNSDNRDEDEKKNYVLRPEAMLHRMGVDTSKLDGCSYDDAIGFIFPDDPNLEDSVRHMFDVKDNAIEFNCSTAWGEFEDCWKALADTFNFDHWCAFSEVDGDYWVANDPDKKVFKINYIFDCYGQETVAEYIEFEEYETEKALVDDLNDKLGKPFGVTFDTADEWREFLYDEYEDEMVKEIARDEEISKEELDSLIER